MHVSIHELPSQHNTVDPTPEPILSISSSVYSSDDKVSAPAAPTTAAPAPTPASIHKGPEHFCIKKERREWYDCLRPLPSYQGWGGMGVDTDSYPYDAFTTKHPWPQRDIYCCFYTGI